MGDGYLLRWLPGRSPGWPGLQTFGTVLPESEKPTVRAFCVRNVEGVLSESDFIGCALPPRRWGSCLRRGVMSSEVGLLSSVGLAHAGVSGALLAVQPDRPAMSSVPRLPPGPLKPRAASCKGFCVETAPEDSSLLRLVDLQVCVRR